MDQAGERIPADGLAGRILQLHVQHMLPMCTFEPSIQCGKVGAWRQLVSALQADLQMLLRRRLQELLGKVSEAAAARARALTAAGGAAGASSSASAPASAAAAAAAGSDPITTLLGVAGGTALTPCQLLLRVVASTLPELGQGQAVLGDVRKYLCDEVSKSLGIGRNRGGMLRDMRGDLPVLGRNNQWFLENVGWLCGEEGGPNPEERLQAFERDGANQVGCSAGNCSVVNTCSNVLLCITFNSA